MTTQIGDQRFSYTMYPQDAHGRDLDGGNAYANADSIEDARDFATRVLGKGNCYSVYISGKLWEFYGPAWRTVSGSAAQWTSETVWYETRPPFTTADADKSCYSTTILDYFERVHELRSDGSCVCGLNEATPWPPK